MFRKKIKNKYFEIFKQFLFEFFQSYAVFAHFFFVVERKLILIFFFLNELINEKMEYIINKKRERERVFASIYL